MRTMSKISIGVCGALVTGWLFAGTAAAQSANDVKLAQDEKVLRDFTRDEKDGIPIDLLQRAHGVVVIPNLIRGGFLVGGRRGRGVLIVRTPNGGWSNGWQFGAESADVVLVLANERSVRNIREGKFTFGGDAAAVAGPAGRRTTAAVTAKSEVYIYAHGRGLFAGAAVEGARLDVDQDVGAIGREAVRLLLERLAGAKVAREVLLPPRLTARTSDVPRSER